MSTLRTKVAGEVCAFAEVWISGHPHSCWVKVWCCFHASHAEIPLPSLQPGVGTQQREEPGQQFLDLQELSSVFTGGKPVSGNPGAGMLRSALVPATPMCDLPPPHSSVCTDLLGMMSMKSERISLSPSGGAVFPGIQD